MLFLFISFLEDKTENIYTLMSLIYIYNSEEGEDGSGGRE